MADKTVSVATAFVDAFSNPLKKAEKALQSFGNIGIRVARSLLSPFAQLTKAFGLLSVVVGGFSLAGFIFGVRESVKEMGRLSREAEALGVSGAFLGNLGLAAERVGASAGTMQTAIQRSKAALDEFRRTGTGPASIALSALNINLRRADGSARSFEDILPDISDGLAGIRNEYIRLERFRAIFGTDDPLLFGLLGGGSQELSRVRAELEALGVSFSDGQIAVVERFSRALDILGESFRGLNRRVAEAIAPIGTEIVTKLAAAVATIPKVIEEMATIISDAFGPEGAIAKAAQGKLDRLFDSAFQLGATLIREGVNVLVAATIAAVDAAVTVLVPALTPRIALLVADVFSGGFGAGLRMLGNAFGNDTLFSRVFGSIADFEEKAREIGKAIAITWAEIPSAYETARRFTQGFSDANDVLGESMGRVSEATRGFFDELNASTGLVDQFNQAVLAIRDSIDRVNEAGKSGAPPLSDWQQFFGAIHRGFTSVSNQFDQLTGQLLPLADGLKALGKDIGQTLGNGVKQFAAGIVDAIQGVKSFGEAFRQVASNILRQISELIIEMLLFRAIGSAGKAFGFGLAQGGVVPGGVKALAMGGVLMGGLAPMQEAMAAIPRAATGMIIPAVPGGQAFVAGEAGDPEAVLPLTRTRGGDLGVRADMGSFGGGGGAINIAINVSMHGAARNDAEAQRQGQLIGKEAASQLISVLERSPALRHRFHALPGAKK